jgi:hypothetical protein
MAARTLGARHDAPAEQEPSEARAAPARSDRLALVTLALAFVPLGAALVHALGRWTATGDNALITLRSLDVLTRNTPLLGTWTSASRTIGFDVNNPGPLQFDLLALPARFLGREGPAIAVIAMHVATVVGIFLVARRRGGPVVASVAMLGTAALCWSMGSEVLVEPWQPHALLLPFLLLLFLVWSASCGDLVAVPWMVGIGSVIVQTHVSYGLLVPPLCVWALVGLFLTRRQERRDDGGPGRGVRRVVVVTLVVAALCWSQPLAEQLFGRGEGNMSRLVRAATAEAPEPIGYGKAVRLAGDVVGLPPFWLRPSFGHAWYVVPPEAGLPPQGADPPGLAPAAVSLVVVAGLLLLCIVLARRRRDLVAGRAAVTALLAVGLGVVTASRVPMGEFALAAHQFRFLWPIAAFATFALVATVVRIAPRRAAWPVMAAITGVTALVAVLALPASDQGVSAPTSAQAVIRDIGPQLSSIEGQGPLAIDHLFDFFGDPYGGALLVELRAHGVRFVTLHESLGRQLGDRRVVRRDEVHDELFMRIGEGARTTPPGTRRVAFHDGLTAPQRRELDRLRTEVSTFLDGRRDLPLTDDANAYMDLGVAPRLRDQLRAGKGLDGAVLVSGRDLVLLVRRGMVDVHGAERRRLERYADLQLRADSETLGVYLGPLR